MKRICIYPKEVSIITGKSISSSRELINIIKAVHGKRKHQLVTIKEFCDYQALPFEEVFNMINERSHDIKQDA